MPIFELSRLVSMQTKRGRSANTQMHTHSNSKLKYFKLSFSTCVLYTVGTP